MIELLTDKSLPAPKLDRDGNLTVSGLTTWLRCTQTRASSTTRRA
jgi:hypothetical protein